MIRRALAVNHDIGIAAALSYEDRLRSEVETQPDQSRDSETYRGAVDASWEMDLFGRVRRSVEAAQAQAGSREALMRSVQAAVASEVAATWFELRGVEAEIAVVVAGITQSQRESLALVEHLVSAGSASEFDRFRAAALLRNVEVAAPELERRRAVAANALAILVGETPHIQIAESGLWWHRRDELTRREINHTQALTFQ